MSARRRGAAVASSLLALGAALAAVAPSACPGRDSGGGGPTPSAAEVTPLADTASVEEALRFGAFGTVHLLRARTPDAPAHVLLFLTGDGGWDSTARHIARQLAAVDAVVVGVDGRTYLDALRRAPGRCVYPAAALEALSQYVQKRLGRPHYEPPVLVGHSSGAALVYATLAQAPPGTFRGAISLGFCPVLALDRPFCRLGGAVVTRRVGRRTLSELRLAPAGEPGASWVALSGARGEACASDSVRAFAAGVGGATVVSLDGVGHGFGVPASWLPAFRDAYARLTDTAATSVAGSGAGPGGGSELPDVRDLPLVEVRPATDSGGPGAATLAVVLSGDGGWASIDRQLAGAFAARGLPTVGLNSLQYLWRGSTPDSAARDLARVLRHYLPAWRKERVVLVGYSLGAEVLPFMTSRLPADLRARVRLVALLAPSRSASFEFHVTDWIPGAGGGGTALPTRPEIAKLRGTPLLCFYGGDETDSACPGLDPGVATAVRMGSGHHLGGDYEAIAGRILAALR